MIPRIEPMAYLQIAIEENPVTALLGPRQCGKSTLARAVVEQQGGVWFDLESAADVAALDQPELALRNLEGLVVIDEVQRRPELFSTLRPLADRPKIPARFLILGSASPDVVKGVSESLAGRVGFVDLSGFHLGEVGTENVNDLWLRGGFPRSYLASSLAASNRWRLDFIRTFLEQDLPQLGIKASAATLRRFWTMVGHYHGQVWNAAELARALGSSEGAARNYLDILCGTYVARRLLPWHTNLGKRELKAPKVYVRDSGLLHSLLGIKTQQELHSHPKLGASWEGFALEQVLAVSGAEDAYFWGTHAGAELDLLLFRNGKAYGIEFKVNDGPRMTRSLHSALADLELEQAWIVHPGTKRYPVHDKVEALPISQISTLRTLFH